MIHKKISSFIAVMYAGCLAAQSQLVAVIVGVSKQKVRLKIIIVQLTDLEILR